MRLALLHVVNDVRSSIADIRVVGAAVRAAEEHADYRHLVSCDQLAARAGMTRPAVMRSVPHLLERGYLVEDSGGYALHPDFAPE